MQKVTDLILNGIFAIAAMGSALSAYFHGIQLWVKCYAHKHNAHTDNTQFSQFHTCIHCLSDSY